MKDIWFKLKIGLNRVYVPLGLSSKYFFELYLMIGPTLLLISSLNNGQNIPLYSIELISTILALWKSVATSELV